MGEHKQLFLVRHGESTGNVEGRFLGVTDAPLSGKGIKQAENLGAFFRDISIGRIFSSPLQRAHQTALAIGRFHQIPVETREELIEQNFGSWDGCPVEEIYQNQNDRLISWRRGTTEQAPGSKDEAGENLDEVMSRVSPFFHLFLGPEMKEALEHSSVIVVAHAGIIQAALCIFLGTPTRNVWPFFPPPGSWTMLKMNRAHPVLVSMGVQPGDCSI
jgi:broad specificity phosphatase PhoE